jgi:hypothetical protein
MSTTQGPELHLDVYVSGQYDPLQLLDVSTSKGHELQMNIPRRQKPVLLQACAPHQGAFTLGPKLYLDVSTLQRPMLHLELSLINRSLSCT